MKKAAVSLFNAYRHNEDGSTAVEFGLIAVVFVTLLLGIIETGRLFLAWNTFQFAFENASRSALVDPSLTEQDLEDEILDEMQDYMVSTANVSIDVNFTSSSGVHFVDISGTYDFDTIVPLLPAKWETIRLTAHTRQPQQD